MGSSGGREPRVQQRGRHLAIRATPYDASPTPWNLPAYGVSSTAASRPGTNTMFVQAEPQLRRRVHVAGGLHVISCVDDQGRVAATSPPMDTRPGLIGDELRLQSRGGLLGGATFLQASAACRRIPCWSAGRARAVDEALADHQQLIQPVQRRDELAGSAVQYGRRAHAGRRSIA